MTLNRLLDGYSRETETGRLLAKLRDQNKGGEWEEECVL